MSSATSNNLSRRFFGRCLLNWTIKWRLNCCTFLNAGLNTSLNKLFFPFNREADRTILTTCQLSGANQRTFQTISAQLGNKTPNEVRGVVGFNHEWLLLECSLHLEQLLFTHISLRLGERTFQGPHAVVPLSQSKTTFRPGRGSERHWAGNQLHRTCPRLNVFWGTPEGKVPVFYRLRAGTRTITTA